MANTADRWQCLEEQRARLDTCLVHGDHLLFDLPVRGNVDPAPHNASLADAIEYDPHEPA